MRPIVSPYLHETIDPLHLDHSLVWNALDSVEGLLRVPTRTMAELRDGNADELPEVTRSSLLTRQLLFPSREAALAAGAQVLSANKSSMPNIVVMPTADCQLGCGLRTAGGYCGQHHEKRRLADEQVERVVDRVKQVVAPGCEFRISFFGGEPLLNVRFIERCLQAVSSEFGPPAPAGKWRGGMVSNGVLLSGPVFRSLHQLGIRKFEVTLDGTRASHDARRPHRSGAPSFDRIVRNLSDIASERYAVKPELVVRANADSRNFNDVLALVDVLAGQGIVPPWGFYVAPVRNWGSARAGDSYAERSAFAKLEIQVFSRLFDLGVRPQVLPTVVPRTCIAAADRPMVLAPDSQWYRCTETPLGALSASDTRRWEDIGWADWQGQLERDAVPCRSCSFLPACGGSCPKEWAEGGQPCPPFVDNILARIRVWYLRNLGRVRCIEHGAACPAPSP